MFYRPGSHLGKVHEWPLQGQRNRDQRLAVAVDQSRWTTAVQRPTCRAEPSAPCHLYELLISRWRLRATTTRVLNNQLSHTCTMQTRLTTLLLLHPFNGLFSRTTWVSWHQKGKPFWILLEQETMGWQWRQLDHVQIICTSLQTDNHASTSSLTFYRPNVLPAAQPTASKHKRHNL